MQIPLARDIEQQGAAARERRQFTSGTVAGIAPLTHTCRVNVGQLDHTGAAVYLEGVKYIQQTPPNVGDVVAIAYTANGAPYIANSTLSNGNGSVTIVGGVTSLSKSGSTKLQNDVTLSQGSGVTLTQSGQNIQIAASSSLAIGTAVGGGTAGRVLFEDGSGNLGDSASFLWDNTNKAVEAVAANLATKKAIIGRELTAVTNDTQAAIEARRVSTGSFAANFGTGFVISAGQNSGAAAQIGALTSEYDGASDKWKMVFRTSYVGDNTGAMILSSRGDLTFTPKTSGAYGLTLYGTTSGSVTSPVAGAIIWDTGAVNIKVYNGSAWKTVIPSPLTTKGDIWAYGSADARQAVGTDGQVLKADSSQTTGLIWADSVVELELYNPGSAVTSISMPAALQEIFNNTIHRGKYDLTHFTQARLLISCQGGLAPTYNGTPTIAVQWCTTNTGTFAYLDNTSGPRCQNVGDSQYLMDSGWVNLTAGAKTEVIFRLITVDPGAGSPDTVKFGRIAVQFR